MTRPITADELATLRLYVKERASKDPEDVRYWADYGRGAVDALITALDEEKAEHLKTCQRFVGLLKGYEKAVAKARKLMRDSVYIGNSPEWVKRVYAALDWRNR